MFGMMIIEILVGRNTPSIGETFADIFGPLRQMVRKFGIFNGTQSKALGLLSAAIQKKSNFDRK